MTNELAWYLSGVATLPALYFLYGAGGVLLAEVKTWRRGRCWRCGARLPWGPRLVQRAHSRVRHGLALTMRGRLRKKQWHGMAWWYAQKHGVTRAQWDAAQAQAREARS